MCECPEFDDCGCQPAPCIDCIEPDLMVVRHVAKPSLCDDVINVIKDMFGAQAPCRITFGGSIIQGTTITIIASGSNNAVQFSNDGVQWQDSATFTNQPAGARKYYIREAGNQTCVAASFVTVPGCATPAPSVTSPVNYNQNAAAQPLQASGIGLKWYTSATGGSGSTVVPTPSTATVGLTSYYVSQTLNGCEGPRSLIQVQVSATGCIPGVTVDVSPQVTECINGFVNIKTTDGCTFGFRPTTTACGTGSCVTPVGPSSVTATPSTCDQNGSYLNNGHFEFGPVYNADKYVLWSQSSGAPRPTYDQAISLPGTGLISITGLVGSNTEKVYKLIVFNGKTDCFIERTATLSPVNCSTPCTQPSFTVSKIDPTCNGGSSLANGQLRLSNVGNGNRYILCSGTEFTCPSDYNTAIPLSGSGEISIASNIAFSSTDQYKDFTVRVFNGSGSCFSTAPFRFSNPCYQSACTAPTFNNPVKTAATCLNSSGGINNNASISIGGIQNGTKYGYSVGTTYTGVDFNGAAAVSSNQISITGLAGSANTTQYVIRIWNTVAGCFVDVPVSIAGVNCNAQCTVPVFTITEQKPTCSNGAANANGKITLTSISNGTKYQACMAQTFNCTPDYDSALAISGSGAVTVLNNYTFNANEEFRDISVRVYNGNVNCAETHSLRLYNPCYVCCGLTINNITLVNV